MAQRPRAIALTSQWGTNKSPPVADRGSSLSPTVALPLDGHVAYNTPGSLKPGELASLPSRLDGLWGQPIQGAERTPPPFYSHREEDGSGAFWPPDGG